MIQWFGALDPRVQAALIAAVVGLAAGFVGPAVKHFFDRWSLRHRLETEHRYSERKKLRELIGSSHGRLLEAANNLNYRLWNLQTNHDKGWLAVQGDYEQARKHYYFTSTVHRFLATLSLCREFDVAAIHIDGRIAEKTDLLFLKYVKAIQWVLTDSSLFKGLEYDPYESTDHIFSGHLEVVADVCRSEGVETTQWGIEQLLTSGEHAAELRPILLFLDGLSASEKRLRWDRVVACHLIVMGFLNTFGYDFQHTREEKLQRIAATLRHSEVAQNLLDWLPRLGLDSDASGKALINALKQRSFDVTPVLARLPSAST